MGQSNTVDIKNLETQQQITSFIEKTEKDTQELKSKLLDVENEINKRKPLEMPDKMMKLYLEVDCACSVPKTVLWLSTTRRNKCTNAKLNLYNELTNDIVQLSTLSNIQMETSTHIKQLEQLVEINKSNIC
jgi:hypothetical protein